MKKSFTISRQEALVADSILLAGFVKETGSEAQAQSILRSMQRLGTDGSIIYYEMTLETRTARHGGIASSAWRVRADRGRPAVAEVSPE